jgi:hypothetical protein
LHTESNLYKDQAMRLLVMLVGFAAVLAVATPAQADPGHSGPDASFLAALNKAGITYQDPAVAIAAGKNACELMDQGHPEVDVIRVCRRAIRDLPSRVPPSSP